VHTYFIIEHINVTIYTVTERGLQSLHTNKLVNFLVGRNVQRTGKPNTHLVQQPTHAAQTKHERDAWKASFLHAYNMGHIHHNLVQQMFASQLNIPPPYMRRSVTRSTTCLHRVPHV
jgi:hypothetical protein